MSKNSFDSIAPWYDALAKLVFGKSIKASQVYYLQELPTKGRILIIGGGTGWILKEVLKVRPELEIDYVEASQKMIDLARKNESSHRVNYILTRELAIPELEYDAIITNFFLDVFDKDNLITVMSKLRGHLKRGGVWLCTDFKNTEKVYHKVLLKVMHLFFRRVSNLEARELQDFERQFETLSLERVGSNSFYGGMILSNVYRPI